MKKVLNKNVAVIFVCWLVYTCSYIGKLGYNANITQIETAFGISHAESGSVGTAFFFAYGAGQVINGILCKKYHPAYVIFIALLVSAGCNFAVPFLTDFAWLKYIWLLNGAALSFLWSLLARFLSENLDKNYVPKAVVAMGTTVACGTFAVYGLSALFVKMSAYKSIFYVASAILPIVAVVWLIGCLSFGKRGKQTEELSENKGLPPEGKPDGKPIDRSVISVMVLLGVFAVAVNLVKDGITVWVPTMLKEIYVMPDHLSILLTLCLPLVAIFGTAVAVFLNRYIKNFVSLCGVFFCAVMLAIGGDLLFGGISAAVLIVCLCIVSLVASGANNVITSMAPLSYKSGNAGLLAGVMNGCSYIGSAVSSYGLGVIADSFGWNGVFVFLISVSALCAVISLCYTLFPRLFRRK